MHAVALRWPKWFPAVMLAAAWVATLPMDIGAKAAGKTCALDGASFMSFGNYDPMSNSPLDMQGRVSYRCYNQKASSDSNGNGSYDDDDDDDDDGNSGGGKIMVQIPLTGGNAGGFNRYMNGSGEHLHYNLYLDPQRQTVWGDGTAGTRFYSEHAQPNNHIVVVPVYGRISGAQDVGAASYLDQSAVTLDF